VIEPAADPREAAAEELSAPATADNPLLLWQLFFPAATSYEAAGLSATFEARLGATSAASATRVLVSRGSKPLKQHDLGEYAGVVLLGTRGSRRQLRKAGFEHVYRYLALPGLEDPRWLLPLEQAHLSAAATLPPMYKLTSRVARTALVFGLKLGTTAWRPRTITIATRRAPGIVGAIEALFPGKQVRFAFAGGTPGPMRKPTVVCIDSHGRAVAYGKVAVSAVTERLVRNEARVLTSIAMTRRLAPVAPRLMLEAECDGRMVAVASALPGSAVGAALGRPQRRYFEALHGDVPEPVLQNPFLNRLMQRVRDEDDPQLIRLLYETRAALANVELPRTLMHGDATPWNMRKHQGTIAAFDWEYGVLDGLPVLDELHYRWNTRLLLDHRKPESVLRELDAASRARSRLEGAQAEALVDVYLIHGLLHRLDMGCLEDDALVAAYRAALAQRGGGR
jgi:hypothetical protein